MAARPPLRRNPGLFLRTADAGARAGPTAGSRSPEIEYNAAPMESNQLQGVAVIGGGPAGLMAAEVLSAAGVRVDVYDAMPSVGRKFLLAGRGGMNITHSEPYAAF